MHRSSLLKIRRALNSSMLKYSRNTPKPRRSLVPQTSYTWWTKFYNSFKYTNEYDYSTKHQLVIFDSELENQLEYSNLHDWAEPMAVTKRQSTKDSTKNEVTYAKIKCGIQIRKPIDDVQEEFSNK